MANSAGDSDDLSTRIFVLCVRCNAPRALSRRAEVCGFRRRSARPKRRRCAARGVHAGWFLLRHGGDEYDCRVLAGASDPGTRWRIHVTRLHGPRPCAANIDVTRDDAWTDGVYGTDVKPLFDDLAPLLRPFFFPIAALPQV